MGGVAPLRRVCGSRPRRKIGLQNQFFGLQEVSDLFRDVLFFDAFFDLHVVKLLGIKDFATFQAFDELRVFLSGNDSYSRVFAGGGHRSRLIGEQLFPPDCSGPADILKQAFF